MVFPDAPFLFDDDEVTSEGTAQAPAVAVVRPPSKAAARTAKPRETDGLKFPHFPPEALAALKELWAREVKPLTGSQHGKFTSEFGSFFLIPEAERPAHLPTNAEVLEAVEELLKVRPRGGRATAYLANPQFCAEQVIPVVKIFREYPNKSDQVERIDRLLGVRSYAHAGSHSRR